VTSYVGGVAYVEATSGTTPTHAVGDLLIVIAIRWPTSLPSLASGWTDVYSSTSGSSRIRIGTKVATATDDSTGTWTNANALLMITAPGVASLASAASAISNTSEADFPALSLGGTRPVIAAHLSDGEGQVAVPAGMTSRWADGFSRVSDTDAPVSSWPATDGGAYSWLAVAMEAVEASPIAGSDSGTVSATEAASVAAAVAGTDSGTLSASETASGTAAGTVTDSGTLSATEAASVSALVGAAGDSGTLSVSESASIWAAASRADLVRPWNSPARDTWPTWSRTDEWEELLSERVRMIAGWAELVDGAGRPAQIEVSGRPRWRLPLSGASVQFDTERQLSFSGTLTFSHPWMVPTTARHPLWGASPLRIRLWWAIWNRRAGAWWPRPVATLAIGDTNVSDSGTISGTVEGRDVLATAIGYGRGAPDVAGMTIDRAAAVILARSAPALQATIMPTSVLVPEGTVLRDPQRDLEELAAAGYPMGVVRSDELGGVYVGPRPASSDAPLAWQEGVGCPVSSIDLAHGVTAMGNEVTAVSTHPDAVGLMVVRSDDDPTSPTYVGGPWGVRPLQVVESSVADTEEALGLVADAALDAGLHPTEDVALTVTQRPDLYGWRPARVAREQLGAAAVAQVTSWPLDLPVPGVDPKLMSVGMMQRRV